jgi:hypothetical protein
MGKAERNQHERLRNGSSAKLRDITMKNSSLGKLHSIDTKGYGQGKAARPQRERQNGFGEGVINLPGAAGSQWVRC